MKARDALIAWTPARHTDDPMAGKVKVGPLLRDSDPDWTRPYSSTGGAAFVERRSMTGHTSTMMVFVDFHTLVVGDGLDPNVVHEAFLAIDEFAETISPDIKGARDPEA